jgi:hypothetical protein
MAGLPDSCELISVQYAGWPFVPDLRIFVPGKLAAVPRTLAAVFSGQDTSYLSDRGLGRCINETPCIASCDGIQRHVRPDDRLCHRKEWHGDSYGGN